MPINPKVKEYLKNAVNLELKRLIFTTHRYNSKLGKGMADAIKYEKETRDAIGKNFPISEGPLTSPETVKIIIKLCPEFEKQWIDYSKNLKSEDKSYGLFISRFAEYVVELYKQNKIEDFGGIFELVELCLTQGKKNVQDTFAITFLENIQDLAGNQDINPEVFVKYLGSESLKQWNEINRFWDDLENYYNKNNEN